MGRIQIEELRVEVPGGEVYVKQWIPKSILNESPIILLHDSLGSVDLWRDFPSLLAENLSRCVFAYDRLGFGKSDARDAVPSKKFIEEEAITYFPAIKDSLSIQRYILLGHSVGGGMAINIASRDPACEAVITVSAQAFVEERTLSGIADAKRKFEQAGQIERLKKWHGAKADWVLRAWTDVWLSSEFADWSLRPSIGRVYCPLLAIHGENDEFGSSAFPQFIVDNAGGRAGMLLLRDCGHVPSKEQPEEVVGAVKEFLERSV